MVASALAMLCLVGGWGWEDPGRTKTGRLIIDEGHSAWEKTNRPYDTEWYGEESGYNYYCLAQFLGYYYQVRHNSAKRGLLRKDCARGRGSEMIISWNRRPGLPAITATRVDRNTAS